MKRKDEVIVGVFVTIAVIVGIAGTLYLARRGWTKTYPMYARFDWGQNLKVGQPVNLAGVQVGFVQTVDLDPAGYLNVKMNIDRDRKIPEGSTISVQSEGIFGDKSLAMAIHYSEGADRRQRARAAVSSLERARAAKQSALAHTAKEAL